MVREMKGVGGVCEMCMARGSVGGEWIRGLGELIGGINGTPTHLLDGYIIANQRFIVVDLPLLRVAVEGSDNLISLEKPFQASLPPDQQRYHSLWRHPKVQYAV